MTILLGRSSNSFLAFFKPTTVPLSFCQYTKCRPTHWQNRLWEIYTVSLVIHFLHNNTNNQFLS
jgi:hypothetical protein